MAIFITKHQTFKTNTNIILAMKGLYILWILYESIHVDLLYPENLHESQIRMETLQESQQSK